ITGEGLAKALEGAQVVVDVANSPSFEDQVAMDFFQTAGKNLIEAEKAAGVQLHVALSVVGTEHLQDSGYFRAKLAQETLIKNAPIPYALLRATQFMEFLRSIAQLATEGNTPTLQIFRFHRGNVGCRIHQPWRNRVHADTEISSLDRERACECLNSRLGAVIGDHIGLRLASPCEVDDETIPGSLQMRESCARGQKRTQQVVVALRTPIIETVLDRSLIAAEPSCQVHQNVNPTVFTYGAVDQPLDLALIGQGPKHSEHTGASVSQLFGPGVNGRFARGPTH